MGMWSSSYTFGNDVSCDWLGEFLQSPGIDIISLAIEPVVTAVGYIESDEAWECLAACEVLSRLQGQWGERNSYSEEIDEWIEENPTKIPASINILALSAIDKILSNSDLLKETDNETHKCIQDIRDRLRKVTS